MTAYSVHNQKGEGWSWESTTQWGRFWLAQSILPHPGNKCEDKDVWTPSLFHPVTWAVWCKQSAVNVVSSYLMWNSSMGASVHKPWDIACPFDCNVCTVFTAYHVHCWLPTSYCPIDGCVGSWLNDAHNSLFILKMLSIGLHHTSDTALKW